MKEGKTFATATDIPANSKINKTVEAVRRDLMVFSQLVIEVGELLILVVKALMVLRLKQVKTVW
jgi:hypothetical protein